MKHKAIPKIALFAAIGLAVLVPALQSGCGKSVSPDEVRLRTKIENETWPKCSEATQKTAYDAYFIGGAFAERLILAGRVSSITEELEHSRTRFLNTGDLVEIFPLIYFYETRSALEEGMRPGIVHKVEYMKLIIAGYDSYKQNREAYDSGDKEAVDQRWRRYFQSAENAQSDGRGKWNPQQGVDVLSDGINAHLLSDMPRAIRYVIKESKVDTAALLRDFDASDRLFANAEATARADILKLFDSESGAEAVKRSFGSGSEFVPFARQKAWESGSGKRPLDVTGEQPHFEHDAGSRKFFPKELVERGICR